MAELIPDTGIPIGATVSGDLAYDLAEKGGIASVLAPSPIQSTLGQEPERTPAFVGIDEATDEVFVNGFRFHKDDHRRALLSEAELDKPITPLPAGFRPIGSAEYKTYLENIDNPSFTRLVKKNFGIGVDISQLLAGNALKFASFGNKTISELGDSVVKQQLKDLAFNEPYQRAFTDGATDSPEAAAEWFVANAAQLAPLMMEMILAAFVGGAVGAASVGATGIGFGGRLLARGGGIRLATLAGRKEAAKLARSAMAKQRKRQKLSPKELKALKAVARAGGALAVGIGDIYGEMEETGTSNRFLAAVLALPYAALEIAPAVLAATTLFKAAGRGALGLKTGGKAIRATKGAFVGGVAEGGTEVFQDILALYGSGKLDFDDPAVQDQLINAFAAGAGVGAPIGGIAAAAGKTPPKLKKDINDGDTPTSILGEDEEVLPLGPEDEAEGLNPLQRELFPAENLGFQAPPSDQVFRDIVDDDAERTADRDSFLDEGDRLRRRAEDLVTEFETMRDDGTLIANEERALKIRQEVQQIDTALAEIAAVTDPQSGLFDDLPGRSAAFAERLGEQPTLPFAAPVDTEAEVGPTQPDLFDGLPPEEAGFSPQAQIEEDAQFGPLEAQEPAVQPDLFDGLPPEEAGFAPITNDRISNVGVQPIEDQRRPTPVRPPGVNVVPVAAAPFVTDEAARSRRFAEEFELAVTERDEQSKPQFVNGEEAILDEATQVLVPVRQLLEKSEKRIDALEELKTCLGKG